MTITLVEVKQDVLLSLVTKVMSYSYRYLISFVCKHGSPHYAFVLKFSYIAMFYSY